MSSVFHVSLPRVVSFISTLIALFVVQFSNHLFCYWTIDPPGDDPIYIEFTEFDVEDFFDRLVIYDGVGHTRTLIGTYWGATLPPAINAASGAVSMTYSTDEDIQSPGWSLNFQTYPADTFSVSDSFDVSECQEVETTVSFSSVELEDDHYILSGTMTVEGEATPWKSIVPESTLTVLGDRFYINESERATFPFPCFRQEP